MHELIYCDSRAEYDELQGIISEQYPSATFEDGSDDIHEYRFVVTDETVGMCLVHVLMCSNDVHGTRLCGCKCEFSLSPERVPIIESELAASNIRTQALEDAVKVLERHHEIDGCVCLEKAEVVAAIRALGAK